MQRIRISAPSSVITLTVYLLALILTSDELIAEECFLAAFDSWAEQELVFTQVAHKKENRRRIPTCFIRSCVGGEYFATVEEGLVDMPAQEFCTVFVPPTRQSGLFSPSGRTQNQQLACYQCPLGVDSVPGHHLYHLKIKSLHAHQIYVPLLRVAAFLAKLRINNLRTIQKRIGRFRLWPPARPK